MRITNNMPIIHMKNKDYIPIELKVNIGRILEKRILQRQQELFKLLDWYLAQNIYYRRRIRKLREKKKK